MKQINKYIVERLHITKDTKSFAKEPPNWVDIDEFNEWLQNEFNYSKKDVNQLKNFIAVALHNVDYKLIQYNKSSIKSKDVDNLIDENIKLYKDSKHRYAFFINGEDSDLFFTTFKSNTTIKWHTIIIIDKDFNLLYTYLLDIILC